MNSLSELNLVRDFHIGLPGWLRKSNAIPDLTKILSRLLCLPNQINAILRQSLLQLLHLELAWLEGSGCAHGGGQTSGVPGGHAIAHALAG